VQCSVLLRFCRRPWDRQAHLFVSYSCRFSLNNCFYMFLKHNGTVSTIILLDSRWHIVSQIRIPQTVEPTIKMLLFQIFFFHTYANTYIQGGAKITKQQPFSFFQHQVASDFSAILYYIVKTFEWNEAVFFFFTFSRTLHEDFQTMPVKYLKHFFQYMRAKHTCCAAGCCWSVCNTVVWYECLEYLHVEDRLGMYSTKRPRNLSLN
jgi:hypothetical protein